MLVFLTACAPTRIVEKPVPVEIAGPVEFVAVPEDLLVIHLKTDIPPTITYGEGALLWAADRESLDKANGQLAGIAVLEVPE